MLTTEKTISQQIQSGKNLKMTDKELRQEELVKLDNNTILILNTESVIDNYRYHLSKYVQKYTMNDDDAIKYQYKPTKLSYDIYGTIELAPLILSINHMLSVMDFTNLERGIKLFTKDITSFISEVLIKEESILKTNRANVIKELSS